eukprot:Awhi_evm1s14164
MNRFNSKKVFSSQLNKPLQETIPFVAYYCFIIGRRCKHHHHVHQEKIKKDTKGANHSNTNNANLKIDNKLLRKGNHNNCYNKKKSTKIEFNSHTERHQLQVYIKNYENYLDSYKLGKGGDLKAEVELKQHQNALDAYLAINNPKAAINIFKKIESKQRRHDSKRQSSQILKSLLQVNGQQQDMKQKGLSPNIWRKA